MTGHNSRNSDAAAMRKLATRKRIIAVMATGALLATGLAASASAAVPDTNSYWKNLAAIEKQARQHLDGAMQACRGRSADQAASTLKEWEASQRSGKYSGSSFDPCSGSGTLVIGKTSIEASNGRASRLTESGDPQVEWDFRTRNVNLWCSGDMISLSINPISVSIQRASLVFSEAPVRSGPAKPLAVIDENLIISGLEAFWRSAHEHYPNHSMYDVALQAITGKDEGREMLLDFIRCGKSLCD